MLICICGSATSIIVSRTLSREFEAIWLLLVMQILQMCRCAGTIVFAYNDLFVSTGGLAKAKSKRSCLQVQFYTCHAGAACIELTSSVGVLFGKMLRLEWVPNSSAWNVKNQKLVPRCAKGPCWEIPQEYWVSTCRRIHDFAREPGVITPTDPNLLPQMKCEGTKTNRVALWCHPIQPIFQNCSTIEARGEWCVRQQSFSVARFWLCSKRFE